VLEFQRAADPVLDVTRWQVVRGEWGVDCVERLHGDDEAEQWPVGGHAVESWVAIPDQRGGLIELLYRLPEYSLKHLCDVVAGEADGFTRPGGFDFDEDNAVVEDGEPVDAPFPVLALGDLGEHDRVWQQA
jgi:hypothetical protein